MKTQEVILSPIYNCFLSELKSHKSSACLFLWKGEIFMSGCPSSRLLNQWTDFYLWFELHTIARYPIAIFVISCNSIITWQMQKCDMGTSLVPLFEGSGVMYGDVGKVRNFH